MIYLYNLATGEYVGELNPGADVPPGLGGTDLPPPPFTATHIGAFVGGVWKLADRALVDPSPLLAAAWSAADTHARNGMDENSRASLLWLAVDPACPSWRRDRIMAVRDWWTSVWTHYATVRATIMVGTPAEFDPAVPGACPWTIWEIAANDP